MGLEDDDEEEVEAERSDSVVADGCKGSEGHMHEYDNHHSHVW